MSRKWYDIKNQTADSAEVFIYDEIGGWGINASQFIGELKELKGKALTVRIHSPGGSILDGHAIYNALARHAGGVTVQIDGLAASMASVIAMAGLPVKMAANAFIMIHNPSTVAIGESEDMRKAADLMDKMKDGLVNIYARRSGRSAEEIESWMDDETWFTADEAKANGFVDEITDEVKVAAKFDVTKFQHAPAALVDTSARAMSTPTLETIIADRDAARAQAQQNFADYQASFNRVTELGNALAVLTAERDTIAANLSAATEANAQLTTELEAARKTSAVAVNAEAARVLGAAGHPPIALGSEVNVSAGDAELYERFKAADNITAREMLFDPTTGPRIRAESARRNK